MSKYRFGMDLQLFSEDGGAVETGVEVASDAGMQTDEGTADQTGVDQGAAAEPEKQNNFEKAFAKRLSAEREKWDSEIKQKYGDYDDVKSVAEYFRETNNFQDIMSLKERIEMERLQERAERENVPPEVLRRLDELESKASRVDQYEQQQQQAQERAVFEQNLKSFCEGKEIGGKPVDHAELWSYMFENGVSKPEVAYKAMKTDALEQQLQNAEKEGMKKLIQAKGSIPTVPGTNAQGSVMTAPPKTLAEARARAMRRLSGE